MIEAIVKMRTVMMNNYLNKCNAILPIVMVSIVVMACGYRFSGGGSLPGGIQTVYIAVFENFTAETGLESIFTNNLIYEFTRSRRESLARQPETADAILNGVIRTVGISNISRAGSQTTLQRRVTVSVDLSLETNAGKILWVGKGITDSEAYDVAADKSSTERNRREALDELSQQLSETIFTRLTDEF